MADVDIFFKAITDIKMIAIWLDIGLMLVLFLSYCKN